MVISDGSRSKHTEHIQILFSIFIYYIRPMRFNDIHYQRIAIGQNMFTQSFVYVHCLCFHFINYFVDADCKLNKLKTNNLEINSRIYSLFCVSDNPEPEFDWQPSFYTSSGLLLLVNQNKLFLLPDYAQLRIVPLPRLYQLS